MSDFDVIVVGGGLAGVCAARDLTDAGRSVLVLEARDRLGGRAWTRRFRGREEVVEMGGTWVSTRVHPHIAEEVRRYHLELTASHAAPTEIRWLLSGRLGDRFPIAGDDIYDLERVLFEVLRASHRIDVDVPRDRQDLADLDVSIETFLDRLQPRPTVRDFLYMWTGLGSGALAQEWSALTALSLIAAMDHSVYGWYGAVTDRFAIGMSGVVERIAADSAASFRLSSPVRSIQHAPAQVRVITRAGEAFTARAAIVATPLTVWPDIDFTPGLSPEKATAAGRGHRGRMRKTWMLVRGLPENMLASGWGTDFVQLFDELDVAEGRLTLGMCPPPSQLDLDDLDAVSAAVATFVPGARVLATDMHDWASDPFAKGTWMVNPPGVLSSAHGALSRREGRVCFAGADVATRWIGWLEGALETGARAAVEVSQLLQPATARNNLTSG